MKPAGEKLGRSELWIKSCPSIISELVYFRSPKRVSRSIAGLCDT